MSDINTFLPDFSATYTPVDIPTVDEIVVTAAPSAYQSPVSYDALSSDFTRISTPFLQLPADLNTQVADFATIHANTPNPFLAALLKLLRGLHVGVKSSGGGAGGTPSQTAAAAGQAKQTATSQNNVALDLGIAAVLAVSLAVIIKNREA